jgi:hypothetical protein
MLVYRPFGRDLIPGIIGPLRLAQELPPNLRGPFLRIVNERHPKLWSPRAFKGVGKAKPSAERTGWLNRVYHRKVSPLADLLAKTNDEELTRQAMDLGVFPWIVDLEWPDPESLRSAVWLGRDLQLRNERELMEHILTSCRALPDARAAFRAVRALLAPMSKVSPGIRAHMLENLLSAALEEKKRLRNRLRALVEYVPILVEFDSTDDQSACICFDAATAYLRLHDRVPDRAKVYTQWILDFLKERSRKKTRTWSEMRAMTSGVNLAVLVAPENPAAFRRIVSAAIEHARDEDWDLSNGIAALGRIPSVHRALERTFPGQPLKCSELLVRLGHVAKLGPGFAAPLEALEQCEEPEEDLARQWRSVVEAAPAAEADIRRYLSAAEVLGLDDELPPGLRGALEYQGKLERQIHYIDERLAKGDSSDELIRRKELLSARLADPESLAESVTRDVVERARQLADSAQIQALEQQTLACYRMRLAVVGDIDSGMLALDDDLLNAALLSANIRSNRKLLKRLLRNHFRGVEGWRERHAANSAFLKRLEAHNVDARRWLARNPRVFHMRMLGRIRVYMEDRPLRILQMGNYFDTCLSAEEFNAFSTVANACDLNKRVIYAENASGRIVGRKLIAINGDWEMVGFRTYSSLTGKAENQRLRSLFRRYCRELARTCGLALADSGTVVKLMAEEWYDDGIVPWHGDDEDSRSTKRAGERTRISNAGLVHARLRKNQSDEETIDGERSCSAAGAGVFG